MASKTENTVSIPSLVTAAYQKLVDQQLTFTQRIWQEDPESARRWAERAEKRNEFIDALNAVCHQPFRALLDLHSEEGVDCAGCDYSGWESDPPPWPCRTVDLIAEQLGIEKI